MLTEHAPLSPKRRTLALTSHQEGPCCTIRLERMVPGRALDEKEVQHMSTTGVFENVVVLRKANLLPVCKPHVMTSYNAYVIDANETGKFLDRKQKKERRDLKFWFYRGQTDEEKLETCSQFVKLLLEAETFPADTLGYIKKNILLVKHFDTLKRVELQNTQEPEVEEEPEEEIPLIENFITVITPAMYDYQYLPEVPVSKKRAVSFRLKAAADGHVALSYVYGDTDRRTYEIVLGGWGNRRSAIRYGGRGEIQVEKITPGLLDKNELREFWISWSPTTLRVGRGLELEEDCFMEWTNIPAKKHHNINLISVSTGPGSDGRWEFVEYIVPYELVKESKGEKRLKVLRGLVWYSKKMKIISRLEEAFPCALDMPDLLRLSTVNLSNMLEALVFLKRTQKDGNVVERNKGIWMRSHAHPADKNHELKKVLQLPRFTSQDMPTVAIVTTTYLEKVSVDAMFDKKVSYLIEGSGKRDKFNNQFYTVGKMTGKNVVSMKISNFNPEVGCSEKHGQCIVDLLSRFESIKVVLVVGLGGAVPDYNNFENHCRRGDVVISCPRPSDGAMYICCAGVDDEPEVDPTGSSAFFPTSSWNSDGVGGELQMKIRRLVDVEATKPDAAWERFIDEGLELLARADERFHRPSEKTDKLMAQFNRRHDPIEVTHPLPSIGVKHLRRENHPCLKKGTVASGKSVAKDLIYRRVFANRNHINAFDSGLDKVMEVVINRVGVENVAMVLGMSDYMDGSVAKSWQPYAGLASAACAKALISML